MYYAIHARKTWEDHVKNDNNAYEGDLNSQFSFSGLFKSIALLYNVEREDMVKYWGLVDNQFDRLGIPRVPDEYRYRFKSSLVLH